jgi:hypothetical protein
VSDTKIFERELEQLKEQASTSELANQTHEKRAHEKRGFQQRQLGWADD